MSSTPLHGQPREGILDHVLRLDRVGEDPRRHGFDVSTVIAPGSGNPLIRVHAKHDDRTPLGVTPVAVRHIKAGRFVPSIVSPRETTERAPMLDTTLWMAQTFLALFFLAAGTPKLLGRGLDRWIGFDAIPRPLTITIGVAEVAAAVALVLPMLVNRLQWTTPLAALGLAAVSLRATGFHIRKQE